MEKYLRVENLSTNCSVNPGLTSTEAAVVSLLWCHPMNVQPNSESLTDQVPFDAHSLASRPNYSSNGQMQLHRTSPDSHSIYSDAQTKIKVEECSLGDNSCMGGVVQPGLTSDDAAKDMGVPETTNGNINKDVSTISTLPVVVSDESMIRGVNADISPAFLQQFATDEYCGVTKACQNLIPKEVENWTAGSTDSSNRLMCLLMNYLFSCEQQERHMMDQGVKLTTEDVDGMNGSAMKTEGNSEKSFFHFPQFSNASSSRASVNPDVENIESGSSSDAVEDSKNCTLGGIADDAQTSWLDDSKNCRSEGKSKTKEDIAVGLLDYFKLHTSRLIQKFLVQQQLLFQEIVATITKQPCVSLQELQLAVKTQHTLIKAQAAQQNRLSRDLEQLMFELDNLSLSCFLFWNRRLPEPLCSILREDFPNATPSNTCLDTSSSVSQIEETANAQESFHPTSILPDGNANNCASEAHTQFYCDDATAFATLPDCRSKKMDPVSPHLETNGFLPEGRLSRIIAATSHHKPQEKRAMKETETPPPQKRNATLVESVLGLAAHWDPPLESKALDSFDSADTSASSSCEFNNLSKTSNLVKDDELTCDATLESSTIYFPPNKPLSTKDNEKPFPPTRLFGLKRSRRTRKIHRSAMANTTHRCNACSSNVTPQWRYMDSNRLCNACYMRLKRHLTGSMIRHVKLSAHNPAAPTSSKEGHPLRPPPTPTYRLVSVCAESEVHTRQVSDSQHATTAAANDTHVLPYCTQLEQQQAPKKRKCSHEADGVFAVANTHPLAEYVQNPHITTVMSAHSG